MSVKLQLVPTDLTFKLPGNTQLVAVVLSAAGAVDGSEHVLGVGAGRAAADGLSTPRVQVMRSDSGSAMV